MARHFSIFIDLGGTPPLVVGAQPALTAKLRLLTGFTPRVDLLSGLQKIPQGLGLPGVHHIDGISLGQTANRFCGRSLMLIDTDDPALAVAAPATNATDTVRRMRTGPEYGDVVTHA